MTSYRAFTEPWPKRPHWHGYGRYRLMQLARTARIWPLAHGSLAYLLELRRATERHGNSTSHGRCWIELSTEPATALIAQAGRKRLPG
jgi:hypothetical protein